MHRVEVSCGTGDEDFLFWNFFCTTALAVLEEEALGQRTVFDFHIRLRWFSSETEAQLVIKYYNVQLAVAYRLSRFSSC